MKIEKTLEKYVDSNFMRFIGPLIVWSIIYVFLYYVCGLSEGPAEETRGMSPFVMMLFSAPALLVWLRTKREDGVLPRYVQEVLERLVVFFGIFVFMYSILTFFSWLGSAETLPYNAFVLALMFALICFLSFIVPLIPEKYRKYFL